MIEGEQQMVTVVFQIDPTTLGDALGSGLSLAGVAVGGKIIACGLPVSCMRGTAAGMLIGMSMVPRAEITLVIMQRGRMLGEWAVPPHVYGAMAVVSAITCLLAPVTVRSLLQRWPQNR